MGTKLVIPIAIGTIVPNNKLIGATDYANDERSSERFVRDGLFV